MKPISEVRLLLDLGLQPISNRYLEKPDEEEQLFPLKLGQCQKTGLIQLLDPVPCEELIPRYDWITYNEPEDHLDDLVEEIYRFLPKERPLNVGGISFKDDSTLERFSKKGLKTWCLDLQNDLGLDGHEGVESVQAAFSKEKTKRIIERYGKSDLLVVRHIWEHVYNQSEFSDALKLLINEDGLILFEIPDCTNLLVSCDITMIWEEHLFYYTPYTLKQSLQQHGFKIERFEIVPYPGENSIIALVKSSNLDNELKIDEKALDDQKNLGENYSKGVAYRREFVIEYLGNMNEEKIAVFGAGHLACAFLTLYNVENFINCIVDDNPNKVGLFMPKSRVPIVPSDQLYNKNVSLCLLAVNPLLDERIRLKLQKCLVEGGKIFSIFPSSRYSIFKEPSS
jgi:hypothetical protein